MIWKFTVEVMSDTWSIFFIFWRIFTHSYENYSKCIIQKFILKFLIAYFYYNLKINISYLIFFMSRWKQYFLVCLRSNILQVLMSLLVLLDAGIVISEIVLEIQSLQSKLNSIIIDIYISCIIYIIQTTHGMLIVMIIKLYPFRS